MKNKTGKKSLIFGILVLVTVFASMVYSHCQLPCGIYSDSTRFDILAEHITTIEKSMNLITELTKQDKMNMNQIVRWVQNKENHSDEFSHIVTYYFMAQRIKPIDKAEGPAYEKYIKKLTLLHEMLVYSMKAKQTTDLSNVEKLKTLLTEFKKAYFDSQSHQH
ncbi:MAG: superoxide dismutase [Ni] [Planctomycetota bacterium]|jgi:nickel superoxide dismutase